MSKLRQLIKLRSTGTISKSETTTLPLVGLQPATIELLYTEIHKVPVKIIAQ